VTAGSAVISAVTGPDHVLVFGILWVDPEPVLFILTITRIPGRPIRTGTEEPCLFG
jgi:hypothetical protein